MSRSHLVSVAGGRLGRRRVPPAADWADEWEWTVVMVAFWSCVPGAATARVAEEEAPFFLAALAPAGLEARPALVLLEAVVPRRP